MKSFEIFYILTCANLFYKIHAQVTVKENNVFVRKRRFLSFPESSNFVVGAFWFI